MGNGSREFEGDTVEMRPTHSLFRLPENSIQPAVNSDAT